MNILLIEDNETIIKGLKYALENNNYHLECKATIKDTIKYLENNFNIDLIILDITLPDGNGYLLFKDYLKNLNIPVIFLTAYTDEETIVNSLELGAEDYITKPFSTKELLVRIKKIIIRNKKGSIIKVKDIKFDMDSMKVYKNDFEIKLTSLELKLLQTLFLNINKVVTRTIILDKIWEWTGNDVDNHTVTVYFNRIRDKLNTDIIKTVKGIGYRIDEK